MKYIILFNLLMVTHFLQAVTPRQLKELLMYFKKNAERVREDNAQKRHNKLESEEMLKRYEHALFMTYRQQKAEERRYRSFQEKIRKIIEANRRLYS